MVSRDVIFEEDKKWKWEYGNEEMKKEKLVWEGCDDETRNDEESEGIDDEVTTDLAEGTNAETQDQSTRTRKPPSYMQDYTTGEGLSDEEEESSNLVMFASFEDPTSFEEAIKYKK